MRSCHASANPRCCPSSAQSTLTFLSGGESSMPNSTRRKPSEGVCSPVTVKHIRLVIANVCSVLVHHEVQGVRVVAHSFHTVQEHVVPPCHDVSGNRSTRNSTLAPTFLAGSVEVEKKIPTKQKLPCTLCGSGLLGCQSRPRVWERLHVSDNSECEGETLVSTR